MTSRKSPTDPLNLWCSCKGENLGSGVSTDDQVCIFYTFIHITTDRLRFGRVKFPDSAPSAPTKRWGGGGGARRRKHNGEKGQRVGEKLRNDPWLCLSYEKHPSAVTPGQINPPFFFVPLCIQLSRGGKAFMHARVHGTYIPRTFRPPFERQLSKLARLTLSIIFREIV